MTTNNSCIETKVSADNAWRAPVWFKAIAAFSMRILVWPGRVYEARATMRKLGSMSDRELRDIGLSRQDVRDATGLALDTDPSKLFAMRAAERAGRRTAR